MAKTLLMSGFDLHAVDVPEDSRILLPPVPLPALDDFRAAVLRAMEEPVSGPPLKDLLKPTTRVAVVLDDFGLPVPPASRDCRREMLEVVQRQLALSGIRPAQTTVLVANGLSRQWRSAELTEFLGPQATSPVPVVCHDAEALSRLVRIGEEPEGPVEFNRAVVESDLVIHLNVVNLPLHAGLHSLVAGTAGYRTARFLHSPQVLSQDDHPLLPGSAFHRIHERLGALLSAQTRLFQISTVLNNDLWAPALAAVLKSTEGGMARPLQVWNTLPSAVRYRAARLLRASYRPVVAIAGPPADVAPKALEVFYGQHEVRVRGPADVLLFGLPDEGPGSVRSGQNPILAAQLALGYVANLYTRRPLLRPGGVLIFANPLQPNFDQRVHGPHQEFYEKVLRLERDPESIHERFEPFFAGRPEFVSNYQRRFAFHGTHPLYAWYLCAPARRRTGRIIVAYGDPRACARLGFTPANDVDDALEKAREFLGIPEPSIAVKELPPPFWARVD